MEVVVFICFLIVPIFTVVCFVLTMMLRKQVKALKDLVMNLMKMQPQTPQQQMMNQYNMETL